MRLLRRLWSLPDRGLQAGRERMVPQEAADGPDFDAARRVALRLARRRLADIFTPTRPLPSTSFDLRQGLLGGGFVGREAEREHIMRLLAEDRAHVVIYGERGRGKTSLANLVTANAMAAGFSVASHVCSARSDFDTIMRGLVQDLLRQLVGPEAVGPEGGGEARNLLPPHAVCPDEALAALGSLCRSRHLLIIDEFDRVTDEATRTAIADMIKQDSDRGMPISFMIVGVSDSAEQLLGHHPSIQRCVARIALPLLTRTDVEDIVSRGEAAGVEYPPSARTCIAELVRGMPYMAQLLALRAGQAALDDGRYRIRGCDLIAAMRRTSNEADPRIRILYDGITHSERDAATLGVLRAAAAGVWDEMGRFSVHRDGPFLRVAGVRVDPTAWRRVLDSGAVRSVHDSGPRLYVFNHTLLPHLVLQRAVLSRQGGPWSITTRRPDFVRTDTD